MPLIPCEGCARELDAHQFKRYLKALSDTAEGEPPAQLCDACSTYGPPSENPLNSLTGAEIEGLHILASGGTLRKAAAAMKTSVPHLVRRLEGRASDRKVFRHAYKALLLQSGVTPNLLVEKIAAALDAEKITFMKDGSAFSQPDYNAQLKAVTMAERIFDLDVRGSAPAAAAPTQNNFYFETNLGNGEKTVDDAYEVYAKRVGDGEED